MTSGSPDGPEDGEHNSVSFVEISKIFVMQVVFFWTGPLDIIYQRTLDIHAIYSSLKSHFSQCGSVDL